MLEVLIERPYWGAVDRRLDTLDRRMDGCLSLKDTIEAEP